jgi:hypothetical protein
MRGGNFYDRRLGMRLSAFDPAKTNILSAMGINSILSQKFKTLARDFDSKWRIRPCGGNKLSVDQQLSPGIDWRDVMISRYRTIMVNVVEQCSMLQINAQ